MSCHLKYIITLFLYDKNVRNSKNLRACENKRVKVTI